MHLQKVGLISPRSLSPSLFWGPDEPRNARCRSNTQIPSNSKCVFCCAHGIVGRIELDNFPSWQALSKVDDARLVDMLY